MYRAEPDGHVAVVYSIKPEQLIDGNSSNAPYANIFSSEDGHAHVWVWSNSRMYGTGDAALRGVLIFDGEKVEQREKFNGISSTRFSFIERKDDRHMWM